MTSIAILQPNYIPWKGYFEIIASVDHFVLYDDVQYTRRDWRNRNKIKTAQGPLWLTLPVSSKGRFFEPINTIEVAESKWNIQHWETIKQAYAKAGAFASDGSIIESWYREAGEFKFLWEINEFFIRQIMGRLNIRTVLHRSSELGGCGHKSDRLLSICQKLNGTKYLSGPAAKSYLDEKLFKDNNVEVEWMKYGPYPEYPQLHGSFIHEVSIIDLLLNLGSEAAQYFRRDNSINHNHNL